VLETDSPGLKLKCSEEEEEDNDDECEMIYDDADYLNVMLRMLIKLI
jgi:hypothetical protein